MIRILAVLLICLTALVGCNRSNDAEVAKEKARADAVAAEAQAVKDELASVRFSLTHCFDGNLINKLSCDQRHRGCRCRASSKRTTERNPVECLAAIDLPFGDSVLEMKPGDFVNIPAHKKHRLEWTTPEQARNAMEDMAA